MGLKVIRDYIFEQVKKRYAIVERDDGSSVEVGGDLDMTDEEAVAKCPPVDETDESIPSEGRQMKSAIESATDEEIRVEAEKRAIVAYLAKIEDISKEDFIAEAKRRELTAKDLDTSSEASE